MAALREAKRQGVVRFIGASGHLHPTRFHEALDSGEIDVLMNAVNFVVQHTYDFEHKVWSRARHMNVGLVAMKVLGGAVREEGGFKVDEKYYEQAIRYALSVPGIAVAVIGLENIAELEKAASVVARNQPLSPEENLELARIGLELAGTPEWKAPTVRRWRDPALSTLTIEVRLDLQSTTLSWISSEFPFSSGAYMACALAGRRGTCRGSRPAAGS